MRFFARQFHRHKASYGLAAIWGISLIFPSTGLAQTAADYFVHSLPGAPDGPLLKMHAGHIEIHPEHNGNMFFWHYQNRHIANRQRTVIWLNGGPGCSSEDGALMEIGPYRVKDPNGPKLEYNPGSWDEFANVMFVDNPVGTGFSFVDSNSYVTDLPEMANQFVIFLEKWFALFPEYENDDIYLAGESYAGQHIPYIAKAMLDRNKAGGGKVPWQLKGMLIGNGWVSPEEQYMAYLSFAYEKGLVQRGSDVAKKLESQQAVCVKILKEPGGTDRVDVPECEQILQDLLRETTKHHTDGKTECLNMYDVRLKDTYPSCGMNWPPDLANVTPYLRRKDVVAALHIKPEKKTGWQECNGAVGGAFRARNSKPSVRLLPDILTEVPTVLFSGAEDLICNHIGTEELISNLQWGSAGFYQEARNLTYILFSNSSHMVPFDYSRRTRDMLDRFMKVDIASIGGVPTDSRIDGEKGPQTSVGGHPNSTVAEAAEKEKLDAAKWHAYYKSGEIVLVIVAIAAAAWGWYVWRERRQRNGYRGVFGGDTPISFGGARNRLRSGMGLDNLRNKRASPRDIEAADFDESELDELHIQTPTDVPDRYSVGSESDEEDEKHGSGHVNGKGKAEESS
ncbi:pheromone-processing carboxypeptidase kex1 [Bisporella sp. PMI_857]|nr:pheromone-processing carboxypeptidase kex1 [Bisporella sp. PMI_857]